MSEIREYLEKLQRQKIIRAYIFTPGQGYAEILWPDLRRQTIVFATLQELIAGLGLEVNTVEEVPQLVSEQAPEINATPEALKLIQEHGIDVSVLSGTGKDGKITVRDVNRLLNAVTSELSE